MDQLQQQTSPADGGATASPSASGRVEHVESAREPDRHFFREFLRDVGRRQATRDVADDADRLRTTPNGGNARVLRQLEAVAAAANGEDVRALHEAGTKPTSGMIFLEAVCSNQCEGLRRPATEMKWAVLEDDDNILDAHNRHWKFATSGIMRAIQSSLGDELPSDAGTWLAQLRTWHRIIFDYAPHMLPGEWKDVENRVGGWFGHLTVPPSQVEATLVAGFDRIQSEPEPWTRSSMLEHLVLATHPFRDGNGRVSRIAGNHGLPLRRITRSTVWRQYIDGLERIRQIGDGATWIAVLAGEQRISCETNGLSLDATLEDWSHRRLIPDLARAGAAYLSAYRLKLQAARRAARLNKPVSSGE